MAEAVWGEGQDGRAPFCRFLPIWGGGRHDGGPPSWWNQFGVKNKMAELLSVGFYLFGVEEVKMEAHHHGGGCLGPKATRNGDFYPTEVRHDRSSQLFGPKTTQNGDSHPTEVRHDGSSQLLGVKDVKMEAHHDGGSNVR